MNPYVGNTRPSNVRVCRFRHSREQSILYTKKIVLSIGFLKFFYFFENYQNGAENAAKMNVFEVEFG